MEKHPMKEMQDENLEIWNEAVTAIEESDLSIFEALLENNQNLLAQKSRYKFWQGNHWTLLHIAVINGKPDATQVLLSKNADSNGNRKDYERIDGYWTPLHLAVINFPEIAKKLIAQEAEVDVFVMAAMGMDENLKLALKHNPELIKLRGPDGAFPLHFAASTGKKETCKLLLDHGADLNYRDLVRKETALEWASGNRDMQEFLAQLGTEINAISDIAVIIFYVSDINQSVHFYKNLLGFQINFHNEEWADLSINGTSFGLQKKAEFAGGGSPLISLKTSYLPELATKVIEYKDSFPNIEKLQVGDVQKSEYGDSLLIHDPDGNQINLYNPK